MLTFGIDRIGEERELLRGRLALITSPSGRTSDNRSSIEAVRAVGDLRLLLAPEHGVRGDKDAGELFGDCVDGPSGLPMMSLYRKGSQHLPQEALDAFDTLVYDIQDVGCRYYTFISSLKNAMEDCAAAGKRLVVADRPDPLGTVCEGTLLQSGCESFVGCYGMPPRYGLTCGEFARMVNEELHLGCDLHVVRCGGLKRDMDFADWGKVWVMPSLAMPRFETALLYPGTCLLEGTNCSEGRGTADPFAILGAPFYGAEELHRGFEALGEPGVVSTPVWFTPTSSKHAGVKCGGIHLHITDRRALRPVTLGLRLLELLQKLSPEFSFLPPVQEGGRPFISLLTGTQTRRPAEEVIVRGMEESREFAERTEQFRLYGV